MVTISNNQRDEAVRYLHTFADLMKGDDRTKVKNLCRLARLLAKQLQRREKK